MLLLTNLSYEDNRLCVTVVKVYLMRWRIEEYYKFKKQGFGFEKFLVRSLKSIRNLDLLLSIAIGYIGILSEKIEHSIQVLEIIEASKRLYGLSKFTFYAIADACRKSSANYAQALPASSQNQPLLISALSSIGFKKWGNSNRATVTRARALYNFFARTPSIQMGWRMKFSPPHRIKL